MFLQGRWPSPEDPGLPSQPSLLYSGAKGQCDGTSDSFKDAAVSFWPWLDFRPSPRVSVTRQHAQWLPTYDKGSLITPRVLSTSQWQRPASAVPSHPSSSATLTMTQGSLCTADLHKDFSHHRSLCLQGPQAVSQLKPKPQRSAATQQSHCELLSRRASARVTHQPPAGQSRSL